MADVILKNRAGEDDTYENVERIVLRGPNETEVVYSLEGVAYNYEYVVRSI